MNEVILPQGPAIFYNSLVGLGKHIDNLMHRAVSDDVVAMNRTVDVLKSLAFKLANEIMLGIPQEQCDVALRGVWPQSLNVLKAALQSPLTEDQKGVIQTIEDWYAEGISSPFFARNLILAKLMLVAHRQKHPDWQKVPPQYRRTFLLYQFESYPFLSSGDGSQHCGFLEQSLMSAWKFLNAPDISANDKAQVADIFLGTFDGHYLMLTDCDIRRVMELRYKTMAYIGREYLKTPTEWTPPTERAGKKIRIGLLAGTMFAGSETHGMLGMIAGLDRSKYEIILCCFGGGTNYYHDIEYYRELLDKVDDIVRLSDNSFEDSVKILRELNIDLLWHVTHFALVDMGAPAWTFIHRVARVQCVTLSYFASTTGNPNYQYMLGMAPVLRPKTWAGEFTETELDIKGSVIYVPQDWRQKINREVTREQLNIPEDAIVYFGGAAAPKYSYEMLVTWLNIIKRVPNSYLVLYPFNPGYSPYGPILVGYYSRLQAALEETGISPDRVKILGHVNGGAISFFHKWGHIFLSSLPYGGVTSLSDALSSGLAPVTYIGQTARCNGDTTVMVSYDLMDMVATSVEEYIEKAVRLGTDKSYLMDVRARVSREWGKNMLARKREMAEQYAHVIDEITAREFGEMVQRPSKAVSA